MIESNFQTCTAQHTLKLPFVGDRSWYAFKPTEVNVNSVQA